MRIALCLPTTRRTKFSESNAVNELLFDISFTVSVASARLALETYFASCGDATECRFGDRVGTVVTTLTALYAVAHALLVYSNRLQTEELGHNVLLYLLMAGNVLFGANALLCSPAPTKIAMTDDSSGESMASTSSVQNCQALLDPEFESSTFYWGYAAAVAAQCFVVTGMFLRVCSLPKARAWASHYIVAYGIAGLLWTVMATVENSTVRLVTAWAWPVLYAGLTVLSTRPEVVVPSPLPRHLAVRSRKFFLVMMTQVLQAMVYPTLRYDGSAYSLAAWVLVLLFAFKLLVFDFDNGHRATGFTEPIWVAEVLWTLCGWLLAIGLTVLGATVTASLRDVSPHDEYPPLAEPMRMQLRWTMAAAVTLCLLSTCGMQLALKGSGKHVRRLGKTMRLIVRACTALLCMASPLAMRGVSMVGQVAVLAMLVVLQVGIDMWARTRVSTLKGRRGASVSRGRCSSSHTGKDGNPLVVHPPTELCGCCLDEAEEGIDEGSSAWCCGMDTVGLWIAWCCCSPSPHVVVARDEESLLGDTGLKRRNGSSYGTALAVDDADAGSRKRPPVSTSRAAADGGYTALPDHASSAESVRRMVLCCGHEAGCLSSMAVCWDACDAWYAGAIGAEGDGDGTSDRQDYAMDRRKRSTSGRRRASSREMRAAAKKYRRFRQAVRRFVVGAVAMRLDSVLNRSKQPNGSTGVSNGLVAPDPTSRRQQNGMYHHRHGTIGEGKQSLGSNASLTSLDSVRGSMGGTLSDGPMPGRDALGPDGAVRGVASQSRYVDESIGVAVTRVAYDSGIDDGADVHRDTGAGSDHRLSLRRSAVEARLRARGSASGRLRIPVSGGSPRGSGRGTRSWSQRMQPPARIPEDGPLLLADHEPTPGTGGSVDPRSLVGVPVPVSRAGMLEPEGVPGAGDTAAAEDGWGSMRSFGSPGWGAERLGSRGVTSGASRPGTGTDVGAIGGAAAGPVVPRVTRARRSASNAVPWSAGRGQGRESAARRAGVASGSGADSLGLPHSRSLADRRRRSLRVTRSSRGIGSGALHAGASTAAGGSTLLGPGARVRLRGRRNSVSGVGGGLMHGNRPESGRLLRREAGVDMATVADVRIRMAFAAIAGEASSDGSVRDGASSGVYRGEGGQDAGRRSIGSGDTEPGEEGGAGGLAAAAEAWGFPFGLPTPAPAAGSRTSGNGPGGDAMSQSSNTLFFE